MSRIDFDRVNAAALAYSETLVRFLAPDGRCNGNEYAARNPTRLDRSIGSFSVNLRSGKWHERATGKGGGDLISLWAYVHDIRQSEAAKALAEWLRVPAEATAGARRPNPPKAKPSRASAATRWNGPAACGARPAHRVAA